MTGFLCHADGVNLGQLADLGLPRAAAQIVATLARVDEPLTMRGLAQSAGVSNTTTQQWVAHFAERGLIQQQAAGRAVLCSLNRDHLLCEAITTLAAPWDDIRTLIRRELGGWAFQPVSAAIFGSFARGDGSPESDIDVFLIEPQGVEDDVWMEQLDESGERIARQVGNTVSWIDVTAEEARIMTMRDEPLIRELRRDAVHIFGEPLTSLFE